MYPQQPVHRANGNYLEIGEIARVLTRIAAFCMEANIMQLKDVSSFHNGVSYSSQGFCGMSNQPMGFQGGNQYNGHSNPSFGYRVGDVNTGREQAFCKLVESLRLILGSGQQHLLGEAAAEVVDKAIAVLESNGIYLQPPKVINND